MLVVNSARDPEYLLKFLPDAMRAKLAKFVVVDAVGLAEQRGSSPWMFVRDLSELAFDRMSTEGADERLAIGMGIAAPLIGALVAATGVLPLDGVAERGRRPRRDAARRGPAPGDQFASRHPPATAAATRRPGRASPAHGPLTRTPLTRSEEAPCPYAAPGSRRTCSCRSPE